jgi:hypothetical protein
MVDKAQSDQERGGYFAFIDHRHIHLFQLRNL